MTRIPTEVVLRDWRYGQAQAERLCAELLHVEGYESVDPQCPLGGPDGLKDVLCVRDGRKWVAACYFPTTPPEFKEIKNKFMHDLEGVGKNAAHGLAFFVSQRLTPGERADLNEAGSGVVIEIYHLERIRALLDSPKGYGLRLEYCRIPMAEEEQFGFFSTLKDDLTLKLVQQQNSIFELHKKMDVLMMQTNAFMSGMLREPSSLLPQPTDVTDIKLINFPTANLAVGQLLWIHRIVTDDTRLPHPQRGHFRALSVWIGPPGSTPEKARFVPPPPEEVFPQTEALLTNWREKYPSLIHSTPEDILIEIVKFHHRLLSIHPFLDANGRVARTLLQQQTLELLNRNITATFSSEPAIYYDSLFTADQGKLEPLINLVKSCLE